MYSKAKVGGHAIHPMLIVFPITFYVLTLVAFAVFQFGSHTWFWYRLGYFANIAGVVMAVVAAIPGTIDWAIGIPRETDAKRRGLIHMALNVTTLVLFAINLVILRGTWNVTDVSTLSVGLPLVLALIGVCLTMVAGYHGWELVAGDKVGVRLTSEQERLEPTARQRIDSVTSRDSTIYPV